MTIHLHFLLALQDKQSVNRMMQYIGQRYVPYINHTYDASGNTWEGRYKTTLIDSECLLTCSQYIQLKHA